MTFATRPRLRRLVAALLLLLFVPALASAQTILRVDLDARGVEDGTSWNDAFTDLQDALDAADAVVAGGGTAELWVAAGQTGAPYRPARRRDAGDPRSATFRLADGVAIYGGFQGTQGPPFTGAQEDRRNQRNPGGFTSTTTLSGDIGLAGDPTDNAYNVVYSDGNDASAVLDGFTITDGNADGNVDGSTFRGGGLYVNAGSPTLAQLEVTGNAASAEGGGLYSQASDLTVTRTVFDANEGGGVVTRGSFNTANRLVLRDVLIEGSQGGGLSTAETVLVADGLALRGNRRNGNGGGANLLDTQFTLANVVVVGNVGTAGGGGMYVRGTGSEGTITNAVFARNELAGNEPTDSGSGLCFDPADLGRADVRLVNSIVWDNRSASSQICRGNELEVGYVILEDGQPGSSIRFGPLSTDDPLFTRAPDDGGDGFGDDPATPGIDEGANDDYGNLRLPAGSPGLDAGTVTALDLDGDATRDVTTDFAGDARVFGGTVDLGAYELSTLVSTSATPTVGGQVGFFQLGTTGATVLFTDNSATTGGLTASVTPTRPPAAACPTTSPASSSPSTSSPPSTAPSPTTSPSTRRAFPSSTTSTR